MESEVRNIKMISDLIYSHDSKVLIGFTITFSDDSFKNVFLQSEISNLEKEEIIKAFRNRFSGKIPKSIRKLYVDELLNAKKELR